MIATATAVGLIVAMAPHPGAAFADEPASSVWAWGDNQYGGLGIGMATVREPTPKRVPGLSDVTAIAAGRVTTLWLTAAGTVRAAGVNSDGILGTGDSVNYRVPAPVVGLTGATQIAMGATTSAAITVDGTVWVWGSGASGQLGDGQSGFQHFSRVPQPVPGIDDALSVSVGDSHVLVARADGSVWAWGHNRLCQVGGPKESAGCAGPVLSPRRIPGLSNVVAVAAGQFFSAALTADGAVWVWGENINGQFGHHGGPWDSPDPHLVPGLPPAVATSAGGTHLVAIAADGALWAWGDNRYGQLGDGTTGDPVHHSRPPLRVPGLTQVRAAAAHLYNTLVISVTGDVFTFGRNANGELGHGDTIDRYVPTRLVGLPAAEIVATGSTGYENFVGTA
jgi:alpha-tubulin suppressor-like RCC1 family protein